MVKSQKCSDKSLTLAWVDSKPDLCGVADDEAGGGLVAPVADHHGAAPLPVVGDDLSIVVPEHKGGVQVEWTRLMDYNM